jgi:hypothetical protein
MASSACLHVVSARAWLFAWLCLFGVWATTARAEPGAAERQTARELVREGDRLRDAGDLVNALRRYQGAHALMHVPTTGMAVADLEARLGLLVEARETAQEVLSSPIAAAEPSVFASAREAAAGLASALEARICSLKTSVQPSTAKFSVQIDHVVLPAAARDAPFRTNPGQHVVIVRAPGFVEQRRELTLREGASQQVYFELDPELPPAAAEEAPRPQLLPTDTAYSAAQLDEQRQSGRVRGLVGLSVGAVVLVAGAVSGVLSWSQTINIKQYCGVDHGCDASYADSLRQANLLGHMANIAVPLGVVGIAYGLYELLTLTEPARPSARAGLQLDIAPDAIVLRGTL